MDNELHQYIFGRDKSLFIEDLNKYSYELRDCIKGSRFLVLGGAGSIGSSVVKELLSYNPKSIDVVDLSENNLADLIRDVRSDDLVGSTLLDTFVLDIGSEIFQKFCKNSGEYDYIFNLSAIKHVRSEKDPYTLARMIEVNIQNTIESYRSLASINAKKYFCVSTDKATNPENLMGATKRIMETFLPAITTSTQISTARFANVAFSNGSLLSSFIQRINNKQPIAAPNDILRYFVSEKEAGTLCLFSGILGNADEIFYPVLTEQLHAIGFDKIALKLLEKRGFKPEFCNSENEAIAKVSLIETERRWPVLFCASDTAGEKEIEEFTYKDENNKKQFSSIGVVDNTSTRTLVDANEFLEKFAGIKKSLTSDKDSLVKLIKQYCPELIHKDRQKHLNDKL
ncbi:polysaccharide biosynthesis protein [Octadecabacter sp.]|nr:polysaccharide biosynthesis protein [Octadecabacter sp.]